MDTCISEDSRGASGTAAKGFLVACALSAFAVGNAAGATIELPGITVTGTVSKVPPDVVSRDLAQRSPDIHWPSAVSFKTFEMFAHNQIEINAPCATVWSFLVDAKRWPEWAPISGRVKLKNGSQILQKNTRFSWSGSDLPEDNIAVFQTFPSPMDSKVVEYVPESRIGWQSFGPPSIHGPLVYAYHTWLLTPLSAKKCQVTFEDASAGPAARYARGAYVEIVHINHQRWLTQLKKISEDSARQANALRRR